MDVTPPPPNDAWRTKVSLRTTMSLNVSDSIRVRINGIKVHLDATYISRYLIS